MSEACVILAAGRGQRMGGRNKALLPLAGQSFLEKIAGLCTAASISEIVVVVAEPHEQETRMAAESLGLQCAHNEEPELGMGSSVAVGFAFALQKFASEYCWLWPVDVPQVSPATIKLVSSHRRPNAVVVPCFAERGGHPVLVARSLWSELASCVNEPEGARTVFQRDPARLLRVPVSDERVCLDVDRPEDLQVLGGESQR